MPNKSPQSTKHLKARAHAAKPVVIIGTRGLTPPVLQEIDRALTDHELIKVRINADDRAQRKQMIESIGLQLKAELVQKIGFVAVFYRENVEDA